MEVFRKRLTQTDINKRLAIPTRSVECFPRRLREKGYFDIRVKHGRNKPWTFQCRIAKKSTHLKPVFTKGWLKFVQSLNLKTGDEITLFREDDGVEGACYRIEVKKSIRLFGGVNGSGPWI